MFCITARRRRDAVPGFGVGRVAGTARRRRRAGRLAYRVNKYIGVTLGDVRVPLNARVLEPAP